MIKEIRWRVVHIALSFAQAFRQSHLQSFLFSAISRGVRVCAFFFYYYLFIYYYYYNYYYLQNCYYYYKYYCYLFSCVYCY